MDGVWGVYEKAFFNKTTPSANRQTGFLNYCHFVPTTTGTCRKKRLSLVVLDTIFAKRPQKSLELTRKIYFSSGMRLLTAMRFQALMSTMLIIIWAMVWVSKNFSRRA